MALHRTQRIERQTHHLEALKGGVKEFIDKMTKDGWLYINRYQKWNGPMTDPSSKLIEVLIFEKHLEEEL
jgi:hypothetical protein